MLGTKSVQEITNTLWLNQSTGYSVNILGEQPSTGYMVGGYVPSLVLDPPALEWTPLNDIDRFVRDNLNWLTHPAGEYYAGIWVDSDTGKVYVDISRNVDDLYVALAIATAYGEIAVWDVVNEREIRTEVTV